MDNMYLETDKETRKNYLTNLVAHCSLSLLHSNSTKPYLDYRGAENIFCECFKAENVSRSDVAVDAIIGKLGVGVKTFVDGTAFQKIAEFDKRSRFNEMVDDLEIVKEVSRLRNKRIDDAVKRFDLSELIYHYIIRFDGYIAIYECPMERIDIDGIRYASRTGNTIQFSDGKNNYKFMVSKSTISMEFQTKSHLDKVMVRINEDAMDSIVELYTKKFGELNFDTSSCSEDDEITEVIPENPYLADSVILPLYAFKKVDGVKKRIVPERSGLNQWNASGRVRDPREIYIPIPKVIHNNHPGFFPPRTETFDLELPGGSLLNAKICQSGDKALMSNPNKALGEWLLDRVFEQPVGKILTYEDMENIHVNAVRISKLKNGHYYINFIYVPEGYELTEMKQITPNR